jgi:hypothetical protein
VHGFDEGDLPNLVKRGFALGGSEDGDLTGRGFLLGSNDGSVSVRGGVLGLLGLLIERGCVLRSLSARGIVLEFFSVRGVILGFFSVLGVMVAFFSVRGVVIRSEDEDEWMISGSANMAVIFAFAFAFCDESHFLSSVTTY